MPTDSLNALAIFDDSDGQLDSLLRAQGYTYGDDIVQRAQAGDDNAAFLLAQMYAYGVAGATPDRRRAFALYMRLADKGMPQAQAIAGYMLFHGLGTDEDVEQGMHLLANAVEANDPLGTYLLAVVYDHYTEPTSHNRAYARSLYKRAAEMGVPTNAQPQ